MKFFIIMVLIFSSVVMFFPESEPEKMVSRCPACTLSHSETVDIETILKTGVINE